MTRPYEQLTIEQVAHFPRPGMVVPGRLAFTPDGRGLAYLQSADNSLARSLWRFDLETQERSILAGPPQEREFSREEELRRERMRLRDVGVTDYAFARDADPPVLLVPVGGSLWVSIAGGELTEVAGTAGALDPALTADGTAVAFVREGDLFAAAIPHGPVRQLTHTAVDGLTNGVAEFIAAEELDRDRGFWWSPDGRSIAFIEADSRHIPPYPIVHQGKDTVDVEYHRYPFAGAPNAHLRLGVVDCATAHVRWMDLGADPDFYIADVAWRPDGVLTAQLLGRTQRDLVLVAFQDTTPHVLIHDHLEPWLNLAAHFTRFLDSGEFAWSSERTGFRHLELRDAGGALLRQLTEGDWAVTRLLGVDERRRLVYFTATRDGPTERHIYRTALDGGPVDRMTTGQGWHDGILSRDGRWLVDIVQSREQAPSVRVLPTTGGNAIVLHHDPQATAADLGLRPPSIVKLPDATGREHLFGAIYAPVSIEAGRRYPLVVSVYGGPHAQRVTDSWDLTVDLRAQYLAQQGCYVLKVDNRGSANRGLAFEAWLHRAMGSVEVADQVAAVRAIAERLPVDLERVGIFGWSYGGYMTLMCMLRAPELFRVGVAGAPVTHWDGYDTGYTERYMETPQANQDGYRESAAITHASKLRGQLLIVHGMIDENVHFRHSARFLVALAQAGKDADVRLFPEERHMPRDKKGLEEEERRITRYLLDRLT
jgi:dipeptidyl-peptidase-4